MANKNDYLSQLYNIIMPKTGKGRAEIVGYENGGFVLLLDYGDGRIVKKQACQGVINGTTFMPFDEDFKYPAVASLFPTSTAGPGFNGKIGHLKKVEGGIIGVFDLGNQEYRAVLQDYHHDMIKVGTGTFKAQRNPWIVEPPEEKIAAATPLWLGPISFADGYKLGTFVRMTRKTDNIIVYDYDTASGSTTGLPFAERMWSIFPEEDKYFANDYWYPKSWMTEKDIYMPLPDNFKITNLFMLDHKWTENILTGNANELLVNREEAYFHEGIGARLFNIRFDGDWYEWHTGGHWYDDFSLEVPSRRVLMYDPRTGEIHSSVLAFLPWISPENSNVFQYSSYLAALGDTYVNGEKWNPEIKFYGGFKINSIEYDVTGYKAKLTGEMQWLNSPYQAPVKTAVDTNFDDFTSKWGTTPSAPSITYVNDNLPDAEIGYFNIYGKEIPSTDVLSASAYTTSPQATAKLDGPWGYSRKGFADYEWEVPTGVVDGVNKEFQTQNPDLLPGVIIEVDHTKKIYDDGDYGLSDGGSIYYSTGIFYLNEAPKESVNIQYKHGKAKLVNKRYTGRIMYSPWRGTIWYWSDPVHTSRSWTNRFFPEYHLSVAVGKEPYRPAYCIDIPDRFAPLLKNGKAYHLWSDDKPITDQPMFIPHIEWLNEDNKVEAVQSPFEHEDDLPAKRSKLWEIDLKKSAVSLPQHNYYQDYLETYIIVNCNNTYLPKSWSESFLHDYIDNSSVLLSTDAYVYCYDTDYLMFRHTGTHVHKNQIIEAWIETDSGIENFLDVDNNFRFEDFWEDYTLGDFTTKTYNIIEAPSGNVDGVNGHFKIEKCLPIKPDSVELKIDNFGSLWDDGEGNIKTWTNVGTIDYDTGDIYITVSGIVPESRITAQYDWDADRGILPEYWCLSPGTPYWHESGYDRNCMARIDYISVKERVEVNGEIEYVFDRDEYDVVPQSPTIHGGLVSEYIHDYNCVFVKAREGDIEKIQSWTAHGKAIVNKHVALRIGGFADILWKTGDKQIAAKYGLGYLLNRAGLYAQKTKDASNMGGYYDGSFMPVPIFGEDTTIDYPENPSFNEDPLIDAVRQGRPTWGEPVGVDGFIFINIDEDYWAEYWAYEWTGYNSIVLTQDFIQAGDDKDITVKFWDYNIGDYTNEQTISIDNFPQVDYSKWQIENGNSDDLYYIHGSQFPSIRISAHRMILKTDKLMLHHDMNARVVNPEKMFTF